MRKVLLYLHDQKKLNETLSFFQKEQIAYNVVSDKNLNDRILNLLDLNNEPEISSAFPFSFILFVDMEKEEFMKIIHKMMEENIDISHKAMLTETNKDWKLQDLLAEIEEEHNYMQSYQLFMYLLKEANNIDETLYTEESFTPYRNRFLSAYAMYKKEKLSKEQLDVLNNAMMLCRKNLKEKNVQ